MSKINILDKSIYNLISAGEVVERPCSVVKELIENSIDAGANSISIEIVNGGISKIRVSDNGSGVEKDDLEKAFLPHSTSKITNALDLNSIATFGFRGEALCSIATVSRTTMTSKTKDNDGNMITVIGGEIQEITPVGCVNGTTIMVEDLFFNVPARAKFLKKPKLEESEITNYVSRLILSNPEIAIKYIADGKLIYQSTGNGLFEAIYSIYGKSVVDNLIEIDTKTENASLKGYIGKPTFSKSNRTYQTLSVNNRYVLNQQLSVAVSKAYENFLMKGQFPFYVLNLNVPYDSVDVNVHPNKLEVRFEDSSKIFGFILNSISDKLFNTTTIKQINSFDEEDIPETKSLHTFATNFGSNYVVNDNKSEDFDKNIEYPKEIDLSDDEPKSCQNELILEQKNENFDRMLYENKKSLSQFLSNDIMPETVNSDDGFSHDLAYNLTVKQTAEQQEMKDLSDIPVLKDDIKIVGVIFNTYIIVQNSTSIFMIDQHAGHERILFDKFMKEIEKTNVPSQMLLVPYVLELTVTDYSFIKENLDKLQALGFELENFGTNSFKVNTIPLLLKDISLKEFFDLILKDSTSQFTSKNTEFIRDYIAKCACKSAVKANDILSKGEIEILVEMLKETKTLLCPHGRPIIIEITQKEIEKWFKRIV